MKEIGHCLEVMIIVKIGQTKIMPTGTRRLWWYENSEFSGDLKANFSDDVTLESAELSVVIQTM
jgi:hypothetical protein